MAKKIKVDFSGVEKEIRSGGGRAAHVPEGDYLVKVVSAELRTSDKSGARYFNWRLQITKPEEYKGKTVYYTTSLKPDALWNLRNFIYAALGRNVAGKALSFDPDTLVGKVVAVTLADDEYEGKIRSTIQDVRPKEELKVEDEDEDEDEVEEEEDEELEEVDVDDL